MVGMDIEINTVIMGVGILQCDVDLSPVSTTVFSHQPLVMQQIYFISIAYYIESQKDATGLTDYCCVGNC